MKALQRVREALDRLFDVATQHYYRDSVSLAKAANDHETIRAALEEREGWVLVPTKGCYVVADHPITVANPDKVFEVTGIRAGHGKAYVSGAKTVWFNVGMVRPATHEEALAYEEAIPAAPKGETDDQR